MFHLSSSCRWESITCMFDYFLERQRFWTLSVGCLHDRFSHTPPYRAEIPWTSSGNKTPTQSWPGSHPHSITERWRAARRSRFLLLSPQDTNATLERWRRAAARAASTRRRAESSVARVSRYSESECALVRVRLCVCLYVCACACTCACLCVCVCVAAPIILMCVLIRFLVYFSSISQKAVKISTAPPPHTSAPPTHRPLLKIDDK